MLIVVMTTLATCHAHVGEQEAVRGEGGEGERDCQVEGEDNKTTDETVGLHENDKCYRHVNMSGVATRQQPLVFDL